MGDTPFGDNPFGDEWAGQIDEQFYPLWQLGRMSWKFVRRLISRDRRAVAWDPPPLSRLELGALHQALFRRTAEEARSGTNYHSRYLTGMQAKRLLREQDYIDRRIDLEQTKFIGCSSFGRSVMAFVLADVPASRESMNEKERLRFRCYSTRRGMKNLVLHTDWNDTIRVRGRISGCGWGLGGDPIILSGCEFEKV